MQESPAWSKGALPEEKSWSLVGSSSRQEAQVLGAQEWEASRLVRQEV